MHTTIHPTTKEEVTIFDCLEEMLVVSAEAVRPPERITVSEAAERYHIVNNPGQHVGPFSLERTPYLREPMDMLTSLDFTGMAFVGPARTGKSAMAINWLCHTAICDPADFMVVHMAQHTARDWSQADLAKAVRNSAELKKRMTPGRQNDNTFDKSFLSGMRLLITWPTITNLSGKTIPRGWLMDYDRMPQNVDGEGNPFDLGRKRGDTFGRYAMWAAEASPGFDVSDAKWISSSPHEAPPTGDDKTGSGILQIYNRGDRRRWYWRCPQCHEAFEPKFKLLNYPDSKDFMDAAEQVVMACPHDGFPMTPDMQHELNLSGRWIKEGQVWLPDGSVAGTARRSDIASFWMFGPAAGFTDWKKLVYRYLVAADAYERTGDEGPLRTTTNVDQGDAYVPKVLEAGRLPEELKARARHYAEKGVVPPGVRFLITTIDVQAGGRPSFVCHTYGIGLSEDGATMADIWHVDMWKVTKSRRLDEDGERKLIDPAAYPEDWHLLVEEVIERSYPLADDSGRHMSVKLVACDSGGAASPTAAKLNAAKDGPKASVTANAYAFWRWLRDDPEGRNHHRRFHLLKGEPSRTAPRLHRTMPDSQQKDKFAIARGDVPVWAVNSNLVKDQAFNMLGRTDSGGQVHFPVWHDAEGARVDIDWLYTQLTAEVRTPQGWRNIARRRNEAFDLLSYAVAFTLHPDIKLEQMNWSNPPGWAKPWDDNDLVFSIESGKPFAPEPVKPKRSIADLADELG